MIKEYIYNGVTTTPDDYLCKDGDLAIDTDLISDNGSLQPAPDASIMFSIPEGYRLLFIHKQPGYVNYICQAEDGKIAYKDRDYSLHVTDISTDNVTSASSVGNTLILLTTSGLQYMLYKDNDYRLLGSHIPDLPMRFGLEGRIIAGELRQFSASYFEWTGEEGYIKPDKQEEVNDIIRGACGQFLAQQVNNKNYFISPFFVRYALRLYDGTTTMHSAPILMIPSSDTSLHAIHLLTNAITDRGVGIFANGTHLQYKALEDHLNAIRQDWSDIVKGVEIYISTPVNTYDSETDVKTAHKWWHADGSPAFSEKENKSFGLFRLESGGWYHQYMTWRHEVAMDPATTDEYMLNHFYFTVDIPHRSEDAVKADIADCSTFYLLKSFNLDELQTTMQTIDVADGYLSSLTSRETMSDDYDSHNTIVPQAIFTYNHRLNLANVSKRVFDGYHPATSWAYTDGWKLTENDTSTNTVDVSVKIILQREGKQYVVSTPSAMYGLGVKFGDLSSVYVPALYYYYPDRSATKVVITHTDNADTRYVVLTLSPHALLNGAYYFAGWQPPTPALYSTLSPEDKAAVDLAVTTDNSYSMPNTIYTSETDNPFLFPVTGINSVGDGRIIGVSAAVKALSEGQFGQFPLYAFTTEGVWALQVGTNGAYTAIQPVTRDVCIYDKSICQIDSSVLFATARGIMEIQGSDSVCISEELNKRSSLSLKSLPFLDALFDNKEQYDKMIGTDDDSVTYNFKQYVKEAQIIYDYKRQRVIVFNAQYKYAYVFSLRSKTWSIMACNYIYNVNSYPDALVVDSDNSLLNVSGNDEDSSEETTHKPTFVLTRPFKLDNPNAFKYVDAVRQNGCLADTQITQILYGSNDLKNWSFVHSSADLRIAGTGGGTPFRFYRLAMHLNMPEDNTLDSVTFNFRVKDDNNLLF